MNLRRIAIAATLTAAAGAALFAVRAHTPHASSSPTVAASQGTAPHERWKIGSAYVYDLAWTNDSTVRTTGLTDGAAQTISGTGAIRGELTLRCVGEREGAWLLAASLSKMTARSIAVMGNDPLSDPEVAGKTFDGQEAFVAIDPAGSVRAVYFHDGTPELFAYVMRSLLTQLDVTLPDDARAEWTASEPGPSGRANVRYARGDEAGEVTRTRTRYESLTVLPAMLATNRSEDLASTSRIHLDDDGTLASIDDDESIIVRRAKLAGPPTLAATTSFRIRHTGTHSFDTQAEAGPDTNAMMTWHPGDAEGASPKAAQRSLVQLAGDLTLPMLIDELSVFGAGATLPRDFPVRAAAFLTLHPEGCDELAHAFADDAQGPRWREMVTDLLAGTGTARAQGALRSVLESPQAKADSASYVRMLQRLSFVQKPVPETVAMVSATYASARAAHQVDESRAAAYVMGSTAGHLARGGDEEGARAVTAGLVRDLRDAKSDDDKRALIAAIGNAGLADSESLVESFTHDEDASLRAEAATALRRVDSDDARKTLEGMVGDPSAPVGGAALEALGQQTLADTDVTRIGAAVAGGATPAGLDARLVTFFSSHASPPEAVLPAIDAMLARAGDDYQLTLRLQALHAQVTAPEVASR